MKVLLVFTNIRTLIQQIYPTEFGALVAWLKPRGHDIEVVVVNRESQIRNIKKVMDSFKPDLVGFTGISAQFPYVKRCIELTRRWDKKISILAGGKHATLRPEDYLALPEVEAVCVGEGEIAFEEFLKARSEGRGPEGIPGWWYHKDGVIIQGPKVTFIEDHDSLPYMDRGIIDYQENIDTNSQTVTTIMGRGCPWSCTFCSNARLRERGTGTYTRNRSVPNLLGDIEQLSRKYRFSYLYFRDDTFTWDRQWAAQWCEEYPKNFSYPFEILTRSDCLDDDLLKMLADAGCANIWLGLDSGNAHIREKVLRKKVSVDKMTQMTDRMLELGITPTITNMVGLPYETEETIMDSVRANRRIHHRVVAMSQGTGTGPKVFTFSPFPGTELYELSEKEGWLKPIWYGFRVYRDSQNDMPQFSNRQARRAQQRFRYLVYKERFPWRALMFLIFDNHKVQAIAGFIPRRPFYWAMRFLRKALAGIVKVSGESLQQTH
jgi:radical SAM superfamily enzyme YgiQ (UPF0313 family)